MVRQIFKNEKVGLCGLVGGGGKDIGMIWEYEVKRNDWGLEMALGTKETLRNWFFFYFR